MYLNGDLKTKFNNLTNVKPKHRMYLNNTLDVKILDSLYVKPKHRMYLNNVYLSLSFVAS